MFVDNLFEILSSLPNGIVITKLRENWFKVEATINGERFYGKAYSVIKAAEALAHAITRTATDPELANTVRCNSTLAMCKVYAALLVVETQQIGGMV